MIRSILYLCLAVATWASSANAQTTPMSYADARAFAKYALQTGTVDKDAFEVKISDEVVYIIPVTLAIDLNFRSFDDRLPGESPDHPLDNIPIADRYEFAYGQAIKRAVEIELVREFADKLPRRQAFWRPPLADAGKEVDRYLAWVDRGGHSEDQLRTASFRFSSNFERALYGPLHQWVAAEGKHMQPVAAAPARYPVKFIADGVTAVLVADGGEKLLYDYFAKHNPQLARSPNYVSEPIGAVVELGRICHVKAIRPDNKEIAAPANIEFTLDGVNVVNCTALGITHTVIEQ